MAADNPCRHLPGLFFLLLRCGGLCTAHPPPPEGAASIGQADEYEIKVELPIVKGMVSADKGTFRATLQISYGTKLAAALEAALGMPQTASSSSGGCCSVQ